MKLTDVVFEISRSHKQDSHFAIPDIDQSVSGFDAQLYFKFNIRHRVNDNFDKIKTNSIQFQAGDTVYFLPGTTIPRFKFKEYSEQIGCRTVRKVETASHAVINRTNFLEKRTESRYNRITTVSTLINTLQILNVEFTLPDDLGIDVDNIDPNQFVLYDYYLNRYIRYLSKHLNIKDPKTNMPYDLDDYDASNMIKNHRYNYVRPEKLEDFIELENLLANNINLIDEKDVLRVIQADTIIDEQMHKRLEQMIASNDEANITLAMEILANCDVRQSLFYILKLVRRYETTIYYNKSFNHVNFKAFREMVREICKRDIFRHSLDHNDIITIMGEANLLTMTHVNEMMADVKREMSRANNRFFTIESIKATPELLSYLAAAKEEVADATN